MATATVSATARVNSRSSGSGTTVRSVEKRWIRPNTWLPRRTGGADDAGGQDFAVAVARAQRAVVDDVAGQDRFAFAHDGGGEEMGDAME